MILEDVLERAGHGLTYRKSCHEEDVTCLEFPQVLLKCVQRASKGKLSTLNFDVGPVEFVGVLVQHVEVICLIPTGSPVMRRASILAYEDSDHGLHRQQESANLIGRNPFEAWMIELGQQDEFHHVACCT